MNVAQAAAEIFKREGVEFLLAYPLNPLTESCAAAGIRPIIVRQERVGIHMADAISRMTSGEKVGVFACQAGPGVENAFGAVAQAWSEGVPLIFMPELRRVTRPGYARDSTPPSISSTSSNKPSRSTLRKCSFRLCVVPSPWRVTDAPAPCSSKCPATCGTRRSKARSITSRHDAFCRLPVPRTWTRRPRS